MTKQNKHSSQNIGLWIFLSVLLVVVAIFGITYYNNQQANQRQQAEAQKAEKEDQDANSDSFTNELNRTTCLNKADADYQSFVKTNATSSRETADGTVYNAPQYVWDAAAKNRDTAKDDCYRQYPND